MPKSSIVVVSVDGLRASSLGAYGNTSFPTPSLDEFAAESFLFDECYAPAIDLPGIYRSLWQSHHPHRPTAGCKPGESLPAIFASRGYVTSLITDDSDLATFNTGEFHETILEGASTRHHDPQARAREVTETRAARLFAAACEMLLSKKQAAPRLVWLHSKGMYGEWDAPLELQQSLRDEGDPRPVESALPPDLTTGHADDPDAAFQYGCAYAAQVMVLDECWKAFISAIGAVERRDRWMVSLIGTRGFPLGEHGRIGGVDSRLYGEQLHVPWIIRFPSGLGRLGRSSALASHLDLLPTVARGLDETNPTTLANADGMNVAPLARSARAQWRDALFSVSPTSRAIRTSGWCLRQDVQFGASGETPFIDQSGGELYVRPDDRWEANDVAKLCSDTLETLTEAIDDACQRLLRNEPIPNDVVARSAIESA
jgi:arylsulfatase A-like enzyme